MSKNVCQNGNQRVQTINKLEKQWKQSVFELLTYLAVNSSRSRRSWWTRGASGPWLTLSRFPLEIKQMVTINPELSKQTCLVCGSNLYWTFWPLSPGLPGTPCGPGGPWNKNQMTVLILKKILNVFSENRHLHLFRPAPEHPKRKTGDFNFKMFVTIWGCSALGLDSQVLHLLLVVLLNQVPAARRIHPRARPPLQQDREDQGDQGVLEPQILLFYQEIQSLNSPVRNKFILKLKELEVRVP